MNLEQKIAEYEQIWESCFEISRQDEEIAATLYDLYSIYSYTFADIQRWISANEPIQWARPLEEIEEEIYAYLTCLAG
jgi:hypothetical protein